MAEIKQSDVSVPFEDLMDSLAGVIAIPSVKGTPAPGAPFGTATHDALQYMLDLGRRMGFAVKDLDGYAGYIEFGSGPKQVAALCHLDIVPPGDGWTSDPYRMIRTDDRVIGRGVIDDKGPAIACLYAMKMLKDKGYAPRNRIRLIMGLDEECGCGCMAYYSAHETAPDIGFTPDAKFPVVYAEKGILHVTIKGRPVSPTPSSLPEISLDIGGGDKANMVPSVCRYRILSGPASSLGAEETEEVTVYGKSSHASLPQYGVNAISKALDEISVLLGSQGVSNPFVEFYRKNVGLTTDGSLLGIACSDEKSGSLTCNAGLLSYHGGEVSLTFDIRYPVTVTKDGLLATLSDRAAEYGLTAVYDSGMAPLYRDPGSDFVQSLLAVYRDVTGSDPDPIAIGGGTYARSIPNILAFGPVTDPAHDTAHQADEYFLLRDLCHCVKIYEKAFRKMDESL